MAFNTVTDAVATLANAESFAVPEPRAHDPSQSQEQRISDLYSDLYLVTQLLQGMQFYSLAGLVGTGTDEIAGFRVYRQEDTPSPAKVGDIWISSGGSRIYNGNAFVEDVYAIDVMLAVRDARLDALEGAGYLTAASNIAATQLTGTLDPARIPASVKAKPVVAVDATDNPSDLANMKNELLAEIGAGSPVITADGITRYYKGSGDKQDEASYVVGADATPLISQIVGLQAALDAKQDSAGLSSVATSGNYNDLSNRPPLDDRIRSFTRALLAASAVSAVATAYAEGSVFQRVTGDQTALVAQDPGLIDLIVPDADPTGTSGVWQRVPDLRPVLLEQDTPARNVQGFHKRIADGRDFELLANTYNIDSAVTVDRGQMTIKGAGAMSAAFGTDGEQTRIVQTGDDAPIFHVQSPNFALENVELEITGNGSQPHMILGRSSGAADVDAVLIGLRVHGLSTGTRSNIYVNGRGLEIRGGTFLGGTDTMVELDWDGITDGAGEVTGDDLGMRRFSATDFVCHGAALTFMKNVGANKTKLSGINLDGFLFDVGGELFEGTLRQGFIGNGVLNWANDTPIILHGGSEGALLSSISVNGHPSVATRRPNHAIELKAGTYRGVKLSGWIANLIERDAVKVSGDGTATTTIYDLDIDLEAVQSGTLAGARYWGLFENCTLVRPRFRGSFDKHANNTTAYVLKFTNCVLVDPKFDISYDSSTLNLIDPADAVSFIITGDQRSGLRRNADGSLDTVVNTTPRVRYDGNGRVGVGTGSDVLLRSFEARSSSAINIRSSRSTTGAAGIECASLNSASEYNATAILYGAYTDGTDGSEDSKAQLFTLENGSLVEALSADRVAVRPGNDNAVTLGAASQRFSEVFAGTGTINTSDGREKVQVEISDALLRAIERVDIAAFQWKDAIEKKGEAGARIHAGAIAQQVRDAFEAEGLDAARYGLFCADPVFETRIKAGREKGPDMGPEDFETVPVIDPETGEQLVRFGLRYDQLYALGLLALRRKSETIEARLAALEA